MGKSGQKRAKRNEPFYKKISKKLFPHNYLENQLIQFEKLDNDSRLLWADFQNFLAEEREKVLDQVTNSLINRSKNSFSGKQFCRIIGSKFSKTPLSSKGSYLVPPGGRFNFGQSISYQTYFPALYLASDFDVAYAEKFSCKQGHVSTDGLTSLDLDLRRPDSFTYQQVNFELAKIIDLRENHAIEGFFEAIRHIKMPKIYSDQAKRLKINMGMVMDATLLRNSIFDPNYEQWDFWIDQPSPSQWLGHYTRLAGIQGIVYPSIRIDSGFNIAIFLDQFYNTESFVELCDECDFVEIDQRRVDATNFHQFI